ncbi:MAG: hypothetical protein ACJAS9_003795 [Polaribacter sp.]|jgi:hypothetical protein
MKNAVTIFVLGLFVNIQIANAALINSYDFNGGLADTLGAGADLVASGGTISNGAYDFTANQGLRLTSALPSTTDYGIEFSLTVTDRVSGFNKLIDFSDLLFDLGLYIYDGQITFYDYDEVGGTISVNETFILGLERAAGSLSVFLDGILLSTISDSDNLAVSTTNILNFFEDDVSTNQGEAFNGSVDFIRIHNDSSTFTAVPEPSTIVLIGLSILGLQLRKRQSNQR